MAALPLSERIRNIYYLANKNPAKSRVMFEQLSIRCRLREVHHILRLRIDMDQGRLDICLLVQNFGIE